MTLPRSLRTRTSVLEIRIAAAQCRTLIGSKRENASSRQFLEILLYRKQYKNVLFLFYTIFLAIFKNLKKEQKYSFINNMSLSLSRS